MLLLNKYLRTNKLLIVICLFLFKNNISQNLIENSSFENYTGISCIYGSFDNYNATPVYHILDNWYTLNSCDYFNNICSSSTYYSTPDNIFGNQFSKEANAYIGFTPVQFQSELKEYVYQQLLQPLEAGKVYCLSFHVSKADRKEYAVHSVGAYFSNNVLSTGSIGYINAVPQVINQSDFITDTLGWTQIQGCFTANGGEQYITIGNFNSNANTDTLYTGTNNPIPSDPQYAYYYIDDVTLIDQTTVGLIDKSYELGEMSVYPNPANDVLNINLGTIKENTEIKMFDALGGLVLNEKLTAQNSSLKTHHLQSGVYFYTILVGEKNIKTDKIVIIK